MTPREQAEKEVRREFFPYSTDQEWRETFDDFPYVKLLITERTRVLELQARVKELEEENARLKEVKP